MADFLIQATLSNFVVATILAMIAWAVQRRVRSASLANLLWALVLIKLVTPPLLAIPVFEIPSLAGTDARQFALAKVLARSSDEDAVALGRSSTNTGRADVLVGEVQDPSSSAANRKLIFSFVFALWLVISATLLLISTCRIIRFHWFLKSNSRIHSELSNELSARVARQLALKRHPDIWIATANISPFVWWMAGRSIIVVSKQASQELSAKDLRFVITHEMAHIKRRDHWFRWLEWIAFISCWWNPVMWWARTHLRISEEMACDNLVLETASPEVHPYANSLLNMAELLASSAIRPPVVASAINSGGSLEKRLKMMIDKNTWQAPPALRLAIVAAAICVFPLGLVHAQDFEAVERRLGGAVEAGELSLEQAMTMMQALRHSSAGNDVTAKKKKYLAIAREIEAAVEAGKLSKEDAQEKLNAIRRKMFDDHGKDGNADLEAKKQKYMAIAEEIEAAVEAGKVSKEDAEKRLIEMRKAMFNQDGDGDHEVADLEAKKRRYEEAEREIKAAVEAGEVSKEDAERRLIEMRKAMFEDHRK